MISSTLRRLASICLLFALAPSYLCHEQGDLSQQNLRLLCGNHSELNLSRTSQIRALAEIYETNPIACPTSIVEALRDLNQLIEANKNDVCTLEAVNRIRIYYQTYVASLITSKQQTQEDSVELPVALRNFFLGYGLQVSRTCKINMIPTLMYNRNYLKRVGDPVQLEDPLKEKLEEYHELLGGILKAGGKVDNLIRTPLDYDDLLLPRDVGQLVQGNDSPDASDKLYVQANSLHALKVFKAICERRYKSVYRQLIMPILYLSNMGFNYRGEDLKRELDELQANEKVHLYYRVTFFCEAIENFELVEDLADAGKNQQMESTQIVRVLSADEAKGIQMRNEQLRLSSDRKGKYEETDKLIDSIERFVYEPDYSIQIDDVILEESDSDLMKQVSSFATNQNELDRIRSKFMRKFKRNIKTTLQGGWKIVFGRFFKQLDDKAAGASSDVFSNLELAKLLDKHLDETYNTDKPVAGFTANAVGVSRRAFYKAARASREDYKPKIADGFKKNLLGTRFWQFLGLLMFALGVIAVISTFG